VGTIRNIRLSQLHGELRQISYQLTKVQFTQFSAAEAWRPAINAYRCRERITICVDLAGVEKSQIDLQVEPRRLVLRGHRELPEPNCDEEQTLQVLAMEIDHGVFEREFALPINVDANRVNAEQRNGLLWIYLPLTPHA
jgi:HSP20 family protein